MPEDSKPKRIRKPRRNFQRELVELRSYCEINIDVLKEMGQNAEKIEVFEKMNSAAFSFNGEI